MDCWDYDGMWVEETCSPIDAENVLDIVNHNPEWNGNLDQAFTQIWNVLSIINVENRHMTVCFPGMKRIAVM